MNDQVNELSEVEDDLQDEKEALRERLKKMGVSYSNNAGVEALRAKLNAALAGEQDDEDEPVTPAVESDDDDEPVTAPTLEVGQVAKHVGTTFHSTRAKVRAEALKLVRVRISCMNPAKASWPGEFFTVSNEYIGTVRRFIPFGQETDDGWHIEQCLLDFLKTRMYQKVVAKHKRGQIDVDYDTYSREFSIEELPPLTKDQIQLLAKAQLAAGTSSFSS